MKNYPVLYNQQSYPDRLGNSPTETINSSGCFVSSYAMKATYYGHQVTPPELNRIFTGKAIYVSIDPNDPIKCLLADNSLSLVYPDVKYVQTLNYEPIATDLNHLASLIEDEATTVTIRINLGSGNLHFVEAVACDGVSLHIANPWTGKIEDFSQYYGNPVTAKLHAIVYTGPIPTVTTTPSASATPSPLATSFNNAITKANNFDAVAEYLGITPEVRVTLAGGSQAVDKYKQLQGEAEQLQEQNHILSGQLSDLQGKIINLSTVKAVPTPTVESQAPTSPVNTPKFTNGSPALVSTQEALATTPVYPDKLTANTSLLHNLWRFVSFWLF